MKGSPAHITRAVSACLLALLLTAPVALAATPATTVPEDKTPLNLDTSEPAKQAATSGGGGGIARMIVGLAVVLGVIYGLSWVLKQVKAAKEGSSSGAGLASMASLPLGPNRSVHLVRVGHELVLLGVGEKGVTPIRRYDEDEARIAGLLSDDDDLDGVPGGTAKPTAAGNVIENLRKLTVRR
jgi:flagellar protein FliO/FliZ